MFIRKCDILSPYITLYFKGAKKHTSRISGLLSIIAYALILVTSLYYIVDFIIKKDPKAYSYNRYTEDAGYFPLNSSSIFNFIQLCDVKTNEPIPFDFSIIRAIGIDDVLYDDYMNNPDIILTKDHWIYGYCNNNSDTKGISNLINFKYFEQSSCIRKYYDKSKKKYFNTGDEGFRWPTLEKGCSHPNRTYYGIILQRCDKLPDFIKSQDRECISEEEITIKINKMSLSFQVIDNYPDILNYKNPLKKYFYTVTSSISNGVFIVNHLNFNPANIYTHNGIFFDNIIKETSHIFVQNEKHTKDSSNLDANQTTNGCLIGIYFWMQNSLQYYERVYSRLQDKISDIGGIYSIVESAAYILNLLVNKFIVLLDTEDLVINGDIHNFSEKKMKRKPTILRKISNLMSPPRRHYLTSKKKYENNNEPQEEQIDQISSNYQRFIKNGPDIMQNIYNIKKNNINNILIDNLDKRNNIINNNQIHILRNNNSKKQTNFPRNKTFNGYYFNEKQSQRRKSYQERIYRNKNRKTILINNENNDSIQVKIEDTDNKPIEKQNFTWFEYLWFFIHCKKNNKKMAYYENFRAKLISEENIIQNYLDIYKLNELYKF